MTDAEAAIFRGATIVFDLDGTLVDTAPDLLGTVDRMLATQGLDPAPHNLIRPLISYGSRTMLIRALSHHRVVLTEMDLTALWHRYLADYEANVAATSRPFPGVIAALDALSAGGARLAVCTNKNVRASTTLLKALNLHHRFAAVAGRDTYLVKKPDPDHLRFVIRDAGGDRTRAVMIGDSDVDVATAKAAGIPIVGVTFGYTPEPIATYAPNAVIDHYDQLIPVLATVMRSHKR